MDLNIASRMGKYRALPRRLRVALAVIAGGLILIVAATILDNLMGDQEATVASLHSQLARLRQDSAKLRQQVDDYPDLRKHYDRAVAEGLLAIPDRAAMVKNALDVASQYRLSDMKYKLEPQNLKSASNGKYQLDSTLVTFENGALLDIDAMKFWDQILGPMPSYYQITEASLERTGNINAALLNTVRAGQPASTMMVKLTFHWVVLRPTGQEVQ